MKTKNRKRQLEKAAKSKVMKYVHKHNVWINWEGTCVYRKDKISRWNSALQIHTRPDGRKYLSTQIHRKIPLDKVVAICFKPMPQDGNKYILIHKDGNPANCNASNLEWKQICQFFPTATDRKLNNGLTVKFTGKVFDNGDELRVITDINDRHRAHKVAVEPYVCYWRKVRYGSMVKIHRRIDNLMAEAGFVDGDKTLMKRPKILHKDKDYQNFDESNLEWVEESSQEYQAYQKKRRKDMERLPESLNPGHPNPLMKPKN